MLKTHWKQITGTLVGLALLFCIGLYFYTPYQRGRVPVWEHPLPKPLSEAERAQFAPKPPTAPTPKNTQGGHWKPGDEWKPAEAHADAHEPPVKVPPRPTLTPIPEARARQILSNRKFKPARSLEERKRLALENPELLWQPWFIVPDVAGHQHPSSHGALWDYKTVADAVTFSDAQNERMYAIRDEIHRKSRAGTLTEAAEKRLVRKWDEIAVEGLDALTAAKYLLRTQPVARFDIALASAQKAVRKQPKSTEARHVLALVLKRMDKKAEAVAVLRQMLALDPNSSIALFELARDLRATHPQEALGYIQKASQLDARIPKYNFIFGECYEYLGQYDKALEVYQNMPVTAPWLRQNIISIQLGDPWIKPVVPVPE